MPTSSGKATKRAAHLARTYFVAAIPAVVILAPAIGSADHRPIRTAVCDVRTLVSPLLGTCNPQQQPEPQPQPSARPSANPAPSSHGNAQPSSTGSSRAVASGSSSALPPPQAEAPAPSAPDDPAPISTQPAPPVTRAAVAAERATGPGAGASVLGLAEILFAAAMSGGLVWLIAMRRRRRQDELIETALRDAHRMRDVMANYIHEIVTPVTGIMLAAQLLTGRRLSMRARRSVVAQLNDASRRLERMVDLLVTHTALRDGSMRLDNRTMDPVTAIAECVDDIEKRHPSRTVKVHAAASVPSVVADARLVRAAVAQLIDNALKFSAAHEAVDVFVRPDAAGTGVAIAVRDRGIGISAENVERIFEEYDQIDGTSTREFGGVGLGLAFVREVATAHGGRISVDSVPGAGSTFTLCLPVAVAKPVPIRSRSNVAAA